MLIRDRVTDDGGGIIVYVLSKLNLNCIINGSKFEIISFKIKISNDCQIGVRQPDQIISFLSASDYKSS